MKDKKHIAVIGASGNVGRKIIEVMEKRRFRADKISLIASQHSLGKIMHFQNKAIPLISLEQMDFDDIDIAFFAAGSAIAKDYAPRLAQKGALVIDNSSFFRQKEDVILCVPEVNGALLHQKRQSNIIANPNCSTAILVCAIAPLHRARPIERLYIATYQSISGAGYQKMADLCSDLAKKNDGAQNQPANPKSLAFNVIPKIGQWCGDGESEEEQKMRQEMAKILDPDIKISTHCVRVPVLVGHSEAVFIRFSSPISLDEAQAVLASAQGVRLLDDFATPLDCEGVDDVLVSRLRIDPNDNHSLQLWICGDNLLKGAALNAVQIAEQFVSAGS